MIINGDPLPVTGRPAVTVAMAPDPPTREQDGVPRPKGEKSVRRVGGECGRPGTRRIGGGSSAGVRGLRARPGPDPANHNETLHYDAANQ